MILTPEEIASHVARVAVDKLATDVQILDLRELTVMTDYFVIASGDNITQVRAVCNGIMDDLSEHGVTYRRREGWDEARWILLDYGSVIVHTFLDEDRKFYDIERLWGDAPRMPVPEDGSTVGRVANEE